MKRWIPFGAIILLGVVAIFFAERHSVGTRPSPEAVLSMAAEGEHELSRIPANLDRMSDEDEIRIGNELAHSYQSRWQPSDQQKHEASLTEAYIQKVGTTVAVHARRKLPYQFHYIPEPGFINAFALPGGHVFVGEGLMKLMQSEDALAAVLGHEVEHIDLRHCAERVQTEGHLRNLGTLGDLLGLPVAVFTSGYSKEQELEADRQGTALAVASGYSPQGILQLMREFERLERNPKSNAGGTASPVEEAAQVSIQTLQDYFRSHPPADERIQQIEALIRSERWPSPPLRPLEHNSS